MNFYVGAPRFLPPVLTRLGFACLAFNRRGHDILSIRDSRAAEGAAFQLTKEGIEDNNYAARWLAERGFQRAWLIAAQHAVQLVCSSTSDPYHVDAHQIVASAVLPLPLYLVSQMAALMTRLHEEIELGLLTTIENHAIAVTFDDSSITAPSTSSRAERTRPRSLRALCSRTPCGAFVATWTLTKKACPWKRSSQNS
jgi:hypothetical protein